MRSVRKLQRTVQRQLTSIMNTLVCFSNLNILKDVLIVSTKHGEFKLQIFEFMLLPKEVKKSVFYSNVQFKKTKQDSVKSDQLSSSHPYWRTLKASIFYSLGRLNQVTAAIPHGQEESGVFQMCCVTFVL